MQQIFCRRVFETLFGRTYHLIWLRNFSPFLDSGKTLGEQALMFNRFRQEGLNCSGYLSAIPVTLEEQGE